MARAFSQNLIRETKYFALDISNTGHFPCGIRSCGIGPPPLSRLVGVRLFSRRPDMGQLFEIDLGQGADTANAEVDVLSLRRLEDAIQVLVVQKSAPGWLPFVPGSSYWVPPRSQSRSFALEVIKRTEKSLTEEEALSRTSQRGWPSSSYFVEGVMPDHTSTKILSKVSVESAAHSDEED